MESFETKKHVTIVSTGGTIEKTYDKFAGVMRNDVSNLDVMLAGLSVRGLELESLALMNKDSLDMTADDHQLIAKTALDLANKRDGVVIVHGTDTLAITGETLVAYPEIKVPIVITGAMIPYALRSSDAKQNVIEALLAVQLLPPGVFLVMHNRVMRFPGIVKDRDHGVFVRVT